MKAWSKKMEENVNALSHVKKLIEELNKDVSSNIKVDNIDYVSTNYSYVATLSIDDNKHRIEFERSIIDDLEVALDKYQGTKYFDTLESSLKFNIYINLGQKGLLKDFKISKKLINDRRDWIKDYRVDTRFSDEMANLLYRGLKKLLDFFNKQIEKHKSLDLDYSVIEENKDWVLSLINFYDENNHLNSPGVREKNLQFLKAALIRIIIDLEKMREAEKIPTTISALDKKIYDIVIKLRKDPFLEIKLPEFIHDIAATYLNDETAQ